MQKLTRLILTLCFISMIAIAGKSMDVNASSIVDSGKCGENVTWTLYDDGLLSIEGTGEISSHSSYFKYASSINRVKIENGITKIGQCAFSDGSYNGYINMVSIEIPNSVTEIGGYAFIGCSSLTSVILPDSVTEIGQDAFHDCTNLKSITFPEGMKILYLHNFDGCESLEEIFIPSTVNWLGWEEPYWDSFRSLKKIILPDRCKYNTLDMNYRYFDYCKAEIITYCSKSGDTVLYEHDFRNISNPSICTRSDYYKLRRCNRCGYTEEKYIQATGHKIVVLPGKTATSTQTGLTDGKKCSVCGEIIVKQYILPKIPAKATITKKTTGKKQVKLIYKSANATSYQIQYSLKKNMTGAKTVASTKTNYVIKKLAKKKTYYIRVRGLNKSKQAGAWSNVVKVKVK